MGSRVLLRRDSNVLRKSYLRDGVHVRARGMFDDANSSPSMMMRGQYDPSLEINYVDDPRLAVGETFTRATIATVVDFEGLVRQVQSGEARFYGMRRVENLALFSEDFTNAAWGKLNASVQANDPVSSTKPPAARLLEDSTNGQHYLEQASLVVPAGGTASIYVSVKPGTRSRFYVAIVQRDAATVLGATFDMSAGTVLANEAGITGAIDSDGDGFFRLSIVAPAGVGANPVRCRLQLLDASSNKVYQGTGSAYAWVRRAQVQDITGQAYQGASEYVSTAVLPSPYHGPNVDGVRYFVTKTDGSNIPRYTATAPAVGRSGLLRERASTNLVLQSEDFSTTWTAVGTPTRVAAAKRCGSVVLDLIGDDDPAVVEGYLQPIVFTADAAKAVSIFFAQGSSTSSGFDIRDTSAGLTRAYGIITWAAGVPTVTMNSGTLLGLDTLANGVFRARILTAPMVAANTNQVRVWPANDAAGTVALTGTIYFGGVQAENLDHATSYIPTTTATVTRNKDANRGPAYSGAWFNSVEGTWYAEVIPVYFDASGSRVVGDQGGTKSPLLFGPGAAGNGSTFDGATSDFTVNAVTVGSLAKLASVYRTTTPRKAVVMNNGAIATDAANGFTWTNFDIGEGNSVQFDCMVGRIWFIPSDISDARLKPLTA